MEKAAELAPSDAPSWHRAARLDDVRGDGPHALSVRGTDLVAVRSGGVLRVFEGLCPHQGALLGEGELEGGALVCRNHRWRFDPVTGERIGGARACLRAYPAREVDGDLQVELAVPAPGRAAKSETKQSGVRRALGAEPQVARRTIADLPGPKGLPLVGSALAIDVARLHLVMERWARIHGTFYRFYSGNKPVVVISDPRLAEPIFRERPETYRRISAVERVFDELSLTGVFSAEGAAWRPQRRLAIEALAQRHLRGFYGTLELVASRLVRRWERAADSGQPIDLADELKRFTVDVTVQLVFGHDANTLEKGDEDVIQRHLELIFPALNRRINALIPYWRVVRLPQDRRLEAALREIRSWIGALVSSTRRRLDAEPERREAPSNFLEAMLLARDAEGRPFSEEVIFGNALTMLLAGEDTTAYTLAWAVHHLLDEPAATRALVAELDAAIPGTLPPDLETAGRLAYATAVANESMRLRPVAPLFFFEPLRDVVIGDVAVPKGTIMLILTRPPVLDDARFSDAHRFDPARWLPGHPGAHDAAANVPFGSGPRICPGRSLAILEMRVVLAALYRSFDVERVGARDEVKEVSSFTMMPVGLRVRLRRRRR